MKAPDKISVTCELKLIEITFDDLKQFIGMVLHWKSGSNMTLVREKQEENAPSEMVTCCSVFGNAI